MTVLIVARCKNARYAPFITEQVEAIKHLGVKCIFFGVDESGVFGYLRQIPQLKKAIRQIHPDIIHAHYGLCGLLATTQRMVPVVTTYHGSDINNPKVLFLSKRSIRRSRFNIFVSQKNIEIAKPKKNYELIPCGINLEDFPIIEKAEARQRMGLDLTRQYILFAGAFDNPVKNASLAQAAVKLVPGAELLELSGYSRPQVATLMQAVDALLMTSLTEGSPQVIKEALVCGCPIVSVDVGDVKERIERVGGCFIAASEPVSLANSLRFALAYKERTNGRDVILTDGLTNNIIASRLIEIYGACMK